MRTRSRIGLALPGSFAVAGLALTMLPAWSDDHKRRDLPQSRAELQYSYAPLVRRTAPAVVNVYARRLVRERSPFAGDPVFERFFGRNRRGRVRAQSSLGSGVIVDRSGLMVTNHHVIDGADEIRVAFADGREFPCRVLLKDERVDLAVLQVEGDKRFDALGFGDSDRLEVGDIVLAIGNPFGVGQTVTSGIVSALARNSVGISDFGFFIQTDAAINPGNSGGALISMDGRLIGVNTAMFSRSGGSNGIGFAIPANMVRAVVDAARRGNDRFRQPYIGARFSKVRGNLAEALGMDRAFGALVTAVDRGGPAHEAGLRVGDLVVELNGAEVEHPEALGYRLATAGVGNRAEAEFVVISRGRVETLRVRLAPPGSGKQADRKRIKGRSPLAGLLVADLDTRLARKLRLRTRDEGAVVLDVKRNSPATGFGLRRHDVLLSINGKRIDTVRDVAAAARKRSSTWRLEIDRKGRRIRKVIRGWKR